MLDHIITFGFLLKQIRKTILTLIHNFYTRRL